MCDFMASVLTRERLLYLIDSDSHEDIIKTYGLNDVTESNFVRLELLPLDGNIWNHAEANWVIHIDQPHVPAWYSDEFARREAYKALIHRVKVRFHFGDRKLNINDQGVHYVKDCYGVIKCKTCHVRGESYVQLINVSNAVVRDDSFVECTVGTECTLFDNSHGILRDGSNAVVYNLATATLYNIATAELHDSAEAEAYNSSTLWMYSKSNAKLHDVSFARVYGNGNVNVYDKAVAIFVNTKRVVTSYNLEHVEQ